MVTLGEKIKQLRLEKELKQSELADKAGISRVAVGNYERGTRQPPVYIAEKIAYALGVSVNDLLNTGPYISEKLGEQIEAQEIEFNKLTGLLEPHNLIDFTMATNQILACTVGWNDEAQKKLTSNYVKLCLALNEMTSLGSALATCEYDLPKKYIKYLNSFDSCIKAMEERKGFLLESAIEFGFNSVELKKLINGEDGE